MRRRARGGTCEFLPSVFVLQLKLKGCLLTKFYAVIDLIYTLFRRYFQQVSCACVSSVPEMLVDELKVLLVLQ